MIISQISFGLAGFLLSFYAYHVKKQRTQNPQYRAWCDFGQHASCSRVL